MPSDQLGDEISPLEYDFAIPIEPPARDIFDVSHIDVASTTDVKVLSEAIARYGKLPGGIVVEGEARCDTPINTLEVNAKRPTQLVINGNCDFDTGLSPEEVALICHAVLGTGQADKDFGALSQRQAIGIDNDTVVAETMMNADNALGGTIYGYDSAYALGQAMFPSYQNPFVAEAEAATHHSEVIERLFFNYIEQLHVQVFLKVTNVRFSTRSQGRLTVSSSKITAAIGAMTGEGKPATTMLGEPLAPFSFPFVHKTLQAFLANLGTYARNEPRIARTIAYAELVSLLRCAKKARASYFGHEHVSRLIAIRRRAPLPRFNYTRRSTEFAEVAGRVARELSETSSTRFQGLMAETVGLVFATLAGNFELFETCKSHVLRSIEHLQKKSHFGTRYYDPSQKLPELADRVRGTCHDAVIAACLNAAREKGQTPDERTTYLKDVLRLCDPVSKYLANSVTRCRCVEAKSYLEPGFDPLPELIQVRRDDPSTMQPFSVLARIKEYRRDEPDVCDTPDKTLRAIVKRQHQLGFSQLAVEKQSLWSMLRSGMSDQGALWLLDELQRFDLPLNDYLGMACTYKDPLEALRQLLFARLKLLPATSFSTRFLHRNNLFVGSHELLDHETRQALSAHFSSVRDKVEGFDFLLPRKKSRLQKVLSTFLPLDLQDWWAQFLRTNATFQDTDASKVAILLACELRLRGRTVGELYDKMRKYRTWNPQAALFLLDIDDAKEAAMLASFRQHMKERSSSI